jgi:large subunit ribosomal protein L16
MLTAIIRLCKKSLSKKSKILLYTYPDRFFSSKPQEVRMGKGKGNPSLRIVQYKKGTIFMKIYSFDSNFIIETCLKQCLDRLPIDAKIIRPFASK